METWYGANTVNGGEMASWKRPCWKFHLAEWQDWFRDTAGKYQGGWVEKPDLIIDLKDLTGLFTMGEYCYFGRKDRNEEEKAEENRDITKVGFRGI